MMSTDCTTRYYPQIDTARIHREASEIDLSKELQLLARKEHAMYDVQKEARSVLCAMPSCGQFYFASRPSTEVIRLLTEVNQHLFQCAQFEEDADISLQNRRNGLRDFTSEHAIVLPHCMAVICRLHFLSLIVLAVAAGLAIRLGKTDYVRHYRRLQLMTKLPPGHFENALEGYSKSLREFNVAAAKAEGDRLRIEFLDKAQLKRPEVVRVIDWKDTYEKKEVVLRDWEDSCVQATGYSAISHTYGQEVYSVFNCGCATLCLAKEPRCNLGCCPHDDHAASDEANMKQREVVQDVLTMCAVLKEAGVEFAWHDGVCIAQHKDSEVTDTIGHIGWIYSNAKDTIIFLHYIGKPMAPISPSRVEDEMTSRWHTRVWTLQEAALSKCRRYCVRVGTTPLGDCESLEDFEMKLSLWYSDEFSRVEVIDEERFFEIVKSIALFLNSPRHADLQKDVRIGVWASNIMELVETLKRVCFRFPSIEEALQLCTRRDSKHKGDRINSILTLAKVTGFVAPKDENVEESTLEFFRRQGEEGLALALFSTNTHLGFHSDFIARGHTWFPVLTESLQVAPSFRTGQLQHGPRFTVLGDGKLQVSGDLVGIKVRFTLKRSLPLEVELSAAAQERPNFCPYDDESYGLRSIGHDHVFNMEMKCYKTHIIVSLSEDPSWPLAFLRVPFLGSFFHKRLTIDGRHPLQHEDSFLAYLVQFLDLGR